MAKLDHLGLFVADLATAREWYTSVIGLEVEFDTTDPPAIGLKDERSMSNP